MTPESADRLNTRINLKGIGGRGHIQKIRDEVADLVLDDVELVPPMGPEALFQGVDQGRSFFVVK